jgi:hypothetical protein
MKVIARGGYTIAVGRGGEMLGEHKHETIIGVYKNATTCKLNRKSNLVSTIDLEWIVWQLSEESVSASQKRKIHTERTYDSLIQKILPSLSLIRGNFISRQT